MSPAGGLSLSARHIVLGFALLILGACASAPERNLALERVRASLQELQSDNSLADNAPGALNKAQAAVAAAARAEDEERQAHLTYIAERKVGIAQARAREVEARQALERLEDARREVLMAARAQEAREARAAAERARMLSEARAEAARRARAQAEEARAARRESAQQAQRAREAAEAARRLAEARTREAELARREAAALQARIAELQASLDELETRQTKRGLVVTMSDVLFGLDKAELKPGAVRNLDTLIAFLKEYPARTIRVEGHTDSTGSAAYNRELSEQRAASVRDLLVENGVDPERIVTVGYGEEYPRATNETVAGRQQNRRVEIVLLKEGMNPQTPPPEAQTSGP